MKFVLVIFYLLTSVLICQSQESIVELDDFDNNISEGIHLVKGDGSLQVINGTKALDKFQPRIIGKTNVDSSPGLALVGDPNSDISGVRGILLRAGSEFTLNNVDILKVQNFRTDLMTIHANGNIGIGTSTPNSKIEVSNGDIYVNDLTHGLIMKSPDGQCWRYKPDNSGVLQGTAITCPL